MKRFMVSSVCKIDGILQRIEFGVYAYNIGGAHTIASLVLRPMDKDYVVTSIINYGVL